MWPRFGRFSGLPRMVGGCRLCQMLCFSIGHMLICVVRVFVVVRKSRFFPSPPLQVALEAVSLVFRGHVLMRGHPWIY